jgi:hypothetical protein
MLEKPILAPHFMQSKSFAKPLGSLSPFGIFDHKSGCVVAMVSQLENRGNQSEIAADRSGSPGDVVSQHVFGPPRI